MKDQNVGTLDVLGGALSAGAIETVDLIQTLDPDFEKRDIVGFGTDTVGTDARQATHLSPPYPAHYLFHGAGKRGLQCLANLHRLPATGAILVCPPLKIKRDSGSPLRVLALVQKKAV